METVFTDQNFDTEVLRSSVPVLVDFWAPWCGPCRVVGPLLEELAEEIDGAKLKIGKMNVDENPQRAMEYGIQSIPSFIVFRNGEIVDRFVGGMTKDGFKTKLQSYLS